MDDFVRATSKTIGYGGIKCNCCNDYHWWGNHQKKKKGLSKLRRSRLKRELEKQLKKL